MQERRRNRKGVSVFVCKLLILSNHNRNPFRFFHFTAGAGRPRLEAFLASRAGPVLAPDWPFRAATATMEEPGP
jgi:hypothetical protein